MTDPQLNCIFLGLSLTSTWGNGHATTYRGLLKELARRGHKITFLERDVPWYSENREFDHAPYCEIGLYRSVNELKDRWSDQIRRADVVVIGSYVPDGIAIGNWLASVPHKVAAFYDIDTPVTLAKLEGGRCEYLSRELVTRYDLYLSFTGGPTLAYIEHQLGSACARPLYCSVDPSLYYPEIQDRQWEIGYLGTYASDRQSSLENLLLLVAQAESDRRFVVAGPQYPSDVSWPDNVDRIDHLPATQHREFYNSQRFTLNLTRKDMIKAGFSPSVRLFEAAACGTAIISDYWPGLETIFEPGSEIFPVHNSHDVTSYLQIPEEQRLEVGCRARERTLRFHTAAVRAEEFERYVLASLERLTYSNKCSKSFLHSSPAVI